MPPSSGAANQTLTSIEGFTDPKATLTITVNRADLTAVMAGLKTLEQLEAEGKARLVGDLTPWNQLRSALTIFTPDFEIFPGTRNARPVPAKPAPFAPAIDPLAVAQ